MCLKWIAAIRTEDHGASAGLPRRGVGTSEDADHFADRGAVILYVFEHLVAEDQVEGPGWKREGFPCGVDNMRGVLSGFGGSLEVIFLKMGKFSAKMGEYACIKPLFCPSVGILRQGIAILRIADSWLRMV